MKYICTLVAAGVLVLTTSMLEPPVMATVDLERVFNDITARMEAEGHLEAEIKAFQARADELRTEAERLAEDRDMLVPGTEKFDKVQKELMQTALDYRAMVEFVRIKLDNTRAVARRELFDQIITAAAEYADANGIDFIITNDSALPIQQGTDIQIVQQLALRRIVYARSTFDITDSLIAWMNAPNAP
jgi:Skp family chaperone for outer membrane proteins